MARRQLEIDNTVAAELAGSEDTVLRALEGHLDVDLYLRGNVLTLDGDANGVQTAETVVGELVELIEQGHEIAPGTIEAVTGALDKHESPAEILEDVVWQHRNTRVAPKTVNQKQYVDSIRRHTITFGIGPAGTGKTFLAVAMAAAALSRGDVSRVILTRPAVEAGERLGFLPGDIQAKVDPYLRPLFDALSPTSSAARSRWRRWPLCGVGPSRFSARYSRRTATGKSGICKSAISSSGLTGSRPQCSGSIPGAGRMYSD